MFSFCVEFLGYSNGSTFRRTKAAKLLARFPIVADYLGDGRLTLTNLVELRDVLDEAHVVEILDRAVGKTEDQVKRLVVEIRPQQAPPDLLRKLPSPRNDGSRSGRNLENAAPAAPMVPISPPSQPPAPSPVAAPPAPPPPRPPAPPQARLEPLAPDLHLLRITVSDAFVSDLKAVRHALSHKLPAGKWEDVLHECIRTTLEKIEKRRRGVGKKRTVKPPEPGDGYVPAAVRAEVWERDNGQCTFVGTEGHRCSSEHQVQNHHREPSAKGGESTAANVTLHCNAHNAHAAAKNYGRGHVARKIAAARARKRRPEKPPILPGL